MTGQGIVIGGGIGGLLAARMLAARFERVTVLERYPYPADPASPAPASRRGAPQSRCLHLLMAGGAAAFDEVVPGWREALVGLGAVPIDASADAVMQFPAGWLPRTPSGIITYACSRSLLERVLRRALEAQANVQVLEGQQVVALLGTGRRVAGVRTTASATVPERRPSQPISSWTRAAVARDSRSGSARCPTGRHRRWTRLSSIPERSTCRAGSSWRHTTHPTGTAFQSRRRAVASRRHDAARRARLLGRRAPGSCRRPASCRRQGFSGVHRWPRRGQATSSARAGKASRANPALRDRRQSIEALRSRP